MMPNIVKDMEKAEHSYTVGGSASWNFWNLFRKIKLTKVEHRHTHDQTQATLLSVYGEKHAQV